MESDAKDPVRKSVDSYLFSHLNNNESQYIERQSTQEQLRVTQVDLGTKLSQLKIYETKYAHAKKEILRWKKKFDFVFRENELLSAENANIEACHKQIAYLQQEITFKEEECNALRELVTALEHAHKKARTALKQKNVSKQKSKTSVKISDPKSENSMNEADTHVIEEVHSECSEVVDNNAEDLLMSKIRDSGEEKDPRDSDMSSLKSENSYLLSSLDQKMLQLQLKSEQVNVQRNRIESLQVAQSEQQESFMQTLQEKQEEIATLTANLQKYESNSKTNRKKFNSKESASSEKCEGTAEALKEDSDSNISPPGTPPPLTERDFQSYLSHFPGGNDAHVDQIIQDWTQVKLTVPQVTTDLSTEADEFFQSIPYESQAGARRILEPILLQDTDTGDTEMQVIIRNVSSSCQKKLEDAILPSLRTNKMYRVSYYTMQRRAVLTDVRIVLEKRDPKLFYSTSEGPTLDESQFGKDHILRGPSLDDPSQLVSHSKRTLGPSNQAIFVSKPANPPELNTLEFPLESEEEKSETNLAVKSVLNGQCDVDSSESVLNPHRNSENETKTSASNTGSELRWSSDKNMLTYVSKNLRGRTKQLMGSVVAKGKQVVATAKMIQANANYGKYVHEDTCCHYCRACPIIGARYECTVCVGIEICGTCYGLGAHGLDNSDELFYRVTEVAVTRCNRLDRERTFLELLRFEICRNDLRKFQFCCSWIAGILNGKTSKELQARALEIPNIQRDTRKMFVPLLMRLVSDREDLEVKTEWELENDNSASVKSIRGNGTVCEGDGKFLETLRIWIADQYCTTNPFVERSISKYREQYDHSSMDNLPVPGSPQETSCTVLDNLEFIIDSVREDTTATAFESSKSDEDPSLQVEDPESEASNTISGAASSRTLIRKQSLKF
uniref:Uncharacterized protein AlNc14C189G8396 n=1 Tax=Albugo laibachii Nc14 TaxID=890382 RepID=F0WPQ4_9STRA|nr:conserved hypothetical protein [Albugo laibachii Nc14]CCA24359.1 conserved hypothetical protein [Albugo laibachii Nc14]|eukprot:CCA24359.1 conserved hypothetical protein [Albugo laibachii Nc14]